MKRIACATRARAFGSGVAITAALAAAACASNGAAASGAAGMDHISGSGGISGESSAGADGAGTGGSVQGGRGGASAAGARASNGGASGGMACVAGTSGGGSGGVSSLGGAGTSAAGAAGGMPPVDVVDGSPPAWHCVNWAVNGDNFQTGPLLLSGIFTSDATYEAVKARATAVENAYSDLLKANSFRIPINEPTVNDAEQWARYRAIIDVGVAKKMKVLLGFWAKDTNIGKPADIGAWYTMWGHVIAAYGSNPYVFFDIHNEPHGYSNAEWIQHVKDWLAKFPNVPKNRVVVAGTGWDDNVANVATAFPDMPLLEVHDYVFNGNYPGSQQWGQQLLGRLGSGKSRTLVGEFGTGVAGVDFSTGVESDPGKSFVVGFTNVMHDNALGSCWWPGLWAIPGNSSSWGLLKMNGTQDNLSYSINSQTALERIWHGWGLN